MIPPVTKPLVKIDGPVIQPLVTIDVPAAPLVSETAPSTAVVLAASKSNVPAVVFEPRGLIPTDFIVPVTCAGAWTLGIAEALATSASLPVLLAVGAAAAVSGVAVGLGLMRKSQERVAVSPEKASLKAALPDPGNAHLRMALECENGGTVRIDGAEKYALAAKVVPGDVCERLMATLPRGTKWGYEGATSMRYLQVLKSIGLTGWGCDRFESCDVNAVIVLLSKLGPVTDAQRASIQKNALELLKKSQSRADKKTEFLNELDAGARELVARAPTATAPEAPVVAELR